MSTMSNLHTELCIDAGKKPAKCIAVAQGVIDRLGPELDRLEERDNVAVPDRHDAVLALALCLNSRTGRLLKSAPANPIAAALFSALQFRRGVHVTIGGIMRSSWTVGQSTADAMDTLAVLIVGHK